MLISLMRFSKLPRLLGGKRDIGTAKVLCRVDAPTVGASQLKNTVSARTAGQTIELKKGKPK